MLCIRKNLYDGKKYRQQQVYVINNLEIVNALLINSNVDKGQNNYRYSIGAVAVRQENNKKRFL